MSNPGMSNFFAGQVEHILFQIRCEIPSSDGGRIRRRLGTQAMAGQARVYAETYFLYVAGKNPRRTPLSGKMAIYGWTLIDGIDAFGQAGNPSGSRIFMDNAF